MRKRRYIDEAGGAGRAGAGDARHIRRDASLDLDEGFVDPIGSARGYRNAQAAGDVYRTQAQIPSYRGASQAHGARQAAGGPAGPAARGRAAGSPAGHGAAGGAAGYDDYRARQVQMHARDSGKYHARPSGLDASSAKVSRTPALAICLAVACVVLLLVFVVRAPMLMGTLSKATETSTTLAEQQSQLDGLKDTNQQLQQSIDSMQATIDTYNAKKS